MWNIDIFLHSKKYSFKKKFFTQKLPVAAFSDADKNHDGYLSMDEYIRVFHEHGVNITAEEVALYFATKVFKLNSSLI